MNFDFADVAMRFLITTNGDIKTFHLAFERMFGDKTQKKWRSMIIKSTKPLKSI